MSDGRQSRDRQRVLGDFGEFALGSDDLDAVLTEACRLVGEALGTRRAKVLEILGDTGELLVRAGVGWDADIVGRLRLPLDENSSEAYSIRTGAPVISRDVEAEDRFSVPGFLWREGVRALANVPIFLPGRRPYGLLQVDATEPRAFRREDTEFLRTYATILGPVIDRLHQMRRLRRSETREREREIRFRTVFETAPVGLSLIDGHGRFLRVNRELARILGRGEDELLRLGVADVTEAADIPPSVEGLRRCLSAGETVSLDKRYHLPDGGIVYANSSLTPLPATDKDETNVLVVTVDLTARQQAEQALRDSEERLRLAMEVGSLATWDWNLLTGKIQWSDEHYRMEGFEIGEVEPSYEVWVERVHPGDRAVTVAALDHARKTGTPYRHEFRIRRPDGTARWCAAEGRFFYDGAGRPYRMIGVQRDVTQRREWEEMQSVMMAELQHRTRNLLGVVRSIARQTMSRTGPTRDFVHEFGHRLDALARVQDLFSRAGHERITIGEIVALEIDALGHEALGKRVTMDGPVVPVRKTVVQTLALALHELATNARKYGALSRNEGRLSIRWETHGSEAGEPRLLLQWIESGVSDMPHPDDVPRGGGYGLQLIEKALPYQLNARTSFDLTPDGVHCTIDLPLAKQ